jgi:hypothetical protein
MARVSHLAILAALLPFAGCSSSSGGNDPTDPDVSSTSAALITLHSCEEVDTAVRAAAARAMNDLIDEEKANALEAIESGYCWYAGRGLVFEVDAAAGAPPPSNAADDSSGPAEVSETNNQVAGVDEADFVKNDADGYIYVIADGALQIVDGWPAAETQIIARVELEDTPKRMFVGDGWLLVYSSVAPTSDEVADYDPWYYTHVGAGECTYGYDCDFTGDGQQTRLRLYDITDRTAPSLVRTIDTSATFISARRVGNAVHTVLYEEPELLRTLPISPEELSSEGLCTGTGTDGSVVGTGSDRIRVEAAFERLRAANLEAIATAPAEELLGTLEDNLGDGTTGGRDLETCAGFYDSPLADGTAYLTLMSFDPTAEAAVQTSTIISRPGASYATADAYYVSVRQNPYGGYWYGDFADLEEASTVHKFRLAGASNAYVASGVVKGRVLNQFSMDEYDGHLRIATTTGHVPSPDVHSTLSVLSQEGSALEVVGQVDDIAPTEDIRSVRFVGDQGYIVTFKKTDPLFVFDLADPEHPVIRGELKIPGFSTYMHPLDENHLLTIGYDAEDQCDFAYFQGLLLQIFDVSDPDNPLQQHVVSIGTRGSSSEAATNHLAFNYFASEGVLALPITVCEDSAGGGNYGNLMTFSGVQFWDIDIDAGITLRGQVDHPYVDPYDSETYYVGGACSNWWTDSSSVVQRTIFMDEFAYSLSSDLLKVNDLNALSPDVAELSLVAP